MGRIFLFIILVSFVQISNGQKLDKNELVQFSGVVVTGDSLSPVPYTSIMIKSTFRGTVSDYYGFFSFVAKMNDTVEFAALGFKKVMFIVPDTLTDFRCSLIQMLRRDTIQLPTVRVLPWPTKEDFKRWFVDHPISDDDMDRANRNLDPYKMSFIGDHMAMDGSQNFRNYMQNNTANLYYAGQLPPNNLLNPVAWAKFIQMWQEGAFKKQDKKYDEYKKYEDKE
jgi:hypothetical protein